MNPLYTEFKRKFSVSMYKNLKLMLGEMTFSKDFVYDSRGDLYPIIEKSDDCTEEVKNNRYTVTGGITKRLFCQFFSFATYEAAFELSSGKIGFSFRLPNTEATISTNGNALMYACEGHCEEFELSDGKSIGSLIVSCRPGAFDIYTKVNGKPEYLCTFFEEAFKDSNQYSAFSNGYVALLAEGEAVVDEVLSYLDNGVSIADMRPIKYENGEVILEGGNLYFTASIRMQSGTFQGIFSWIPGTAEFRMTGALFYDCGDGKWRGYVAPVILYHRDKKRWYVWVSSFEHERILAHASFEGDPRFGVNVIDVEFMEKASDTSDISLFLGFKGDEDPDLFYDEENRRWLMAICRINPKTRKYVYVFFESKEPFKGYRYVGRGFDGAETGGSFVRAEGEVYFVCGNDFNKRSEYRIYSKNGMRLAAFNYPDGGFRGWGTVMPIKTGSRTRYFWLTFDRHNGSDYNWSYGNIYCFEA